jgi:two-component system nitrogen regulation sensor histidine kinase NtrY
MLYPELFSHGQNASIENSSEYAYAIYDRGKLISSHNDYAFSTRYTEKYFVGRPFFLDENKKYSELWYDAGNGKYIEIVKENQVLPELITLFSYLFCSFLLLSAFSGLLSLALRSRLRLSRIKNALRFTIRQQVHGTIIFFIAASFIIIGVATILFFIGRYEKNNKETLSRTIRVMEKDLSGTLTKDMVQSTTFQNAQSAAPSLTESMVARLSEVHGPDVNLYTTSGDLKASSLPLPYIKGIVSTKMDPVAFYHLNKGKEIQYFQKEHIGDLDFVSDYIPVTDSSGNEIAYLNIPYFTSQSRLKEEISGFLVTIINLNAFIFLIAGMVALIITNRITRSFTFISEKMKKINLGKRNEAIIWRRDDEIGALVKEYNRMLSKLDESAAALARTEREHAWQEMAKQVAHEIKNPLTPMKLSMQFLQKSIENNAPDIKELGARVSATLVEQIDHLSTIAGEFSRFANIGKDKPKLFNLNEALRSVKQLYEGDTRNTFDWQLLEEPVMINADKTHINRMLNNLILNGIQAVSAGTTPHISVKETRKNNIVEIEITDNGSGISEEAREKIFTPNFTTKSSGTGLGLAMCKRMAEQAGGDISYVTSASGTSFTVKLPVAELSKK